jgi:hypothetical protein
MLGPQDFGVGRRVRSEDNGCFAEFSMKLSAHAAAVLSPGELQVVVDNFSDDRPLSVSVSIVDDNLIWSFRFPSDHVILLRTTIKYQGAVMASVECPRQFKDLDDLRVRVQYGSRTQTDILTELEQLASRYTGIAYARADLAITACAAVIFRTAPVELFGALIKFVLDSLLLHPREGVVCCRHLSTIFGKNTYIFPQGIVDNRDQVINAAAACAKHKYKSRLFAAPQQEAVQLLLEACSIDLPGWQATLYPHVADLQANASSLSCPAYDALLLLL